MSDYIEQLRQIKMNMKTRVPNTKWTEDDVRELLRTGMSKNHPTSYMTMLSNLRKKSGPVFNKFSHVVYEYEKETGNKICSEASTYNENEKKLITQHIVPKGRTLSSARSMAAKLGYTDRSNPQPWRYESERDAELEKKNEMPVIEPFAEVIAKHEAKMDDLTLNLTAVKALINAGMSYAQIAKITGKDENLVIALMKVAEAF